MMKVLTTIGPGGLTEIQWVERYRFDQALDLLRRLEEILGRSPIMTRLVTVQTENGPEPYKARTITAQVEEMDLERIRALLRACGEVVAEGYEPEIGDHK